MRGALHRIAPRYAGYPVRIRGVSQTLFALIVVATLLLFATANPCTATAQIAGSKEARAENPATILASQALQTQDAAQIASGEIGTCTWTIDAGGELKVAPRDGESGYIDFYNPVSDDPNTVTSKDGRTPWYQYADKITSAKVLGTVSITGNSCRMFEDCCNLEKVNLSGLDISQATNLDYMFYNCKKLASIDMSMLKGPSVSSTHALFAFCFELSDLKLPDLKGSQLRQMAAMFEYCKKLVTIDLSDIDTSKVQGAYLLFYYCTSLEKVIVGDKWDLQTFVEENPTWSHHFEYMFTDCTALVGANGTSYADARVDDYTYARIDRSNAPGYLWPASTASNGVNGGGSEPSNGNAGSETELGGGGTSAGKTADADSNASKTPSTTANANAGASLKAAVPDGKASKASSGTANASKTRAAKKSTAKRVPINKADVALPVSTFVYNGKAQTPKVLVKRDGKTLRKGRDYSVKLSKGRKEIGSYKVTVIGKSAYSGKVSKSFKVVPKAPKIKALKAHKNSDGTSGFIVSWSKVPKGTMGYQVRWSPAKSFKTVGTYKFEGSSRYAKAGRAPLQVKMRSWLGKKIYVQVRAYKKVGKTTYYSKWSSAKATKLKK